MMTPRGYNFEHLKLKNDSNMKIESLTRQYFSESSGGWI